MRWQIVECLKSTKQNSAISIAIAIAFASASASASASARASAIPSISVSASVSAGNIEAGRNVSGSHQKQKVQLQQFFLAPKHNFGGDEVEFARGEFMWG